MENLCNLRFHYAILLDLRISPLFCTKSSLGNSDDNAVQAILPTKVGFMGNEFPGQQQCATARDLWTTRIERRCEIEGEHIPLEETTAAICELIKAKMSRLVPITPITYYTLNDRGMSQMSVWLPRVD